MTNAKSINIFDDIQSLCSDFRRQLKRGEDKQIEDLRAELAEAKSANEVLKDKVVAEQQSEFQDKIASLESVIAEQVETIAVRDAAIAEQSEAIKSGEADMKEKMEVTRCM